MNTDTHGFYRNEGNEAGKIKGAKSWKRSRPLRLRRNPRENEWSGRAGSVSFRTAGSGSHLKWTEDINVPLFPSDHSIMAIWETREHRRCHRGRSGSSSRVGDAH